MKKTYKILIIVGVLLLLGSAAVTAYNIWDARRAEKSVTSVVDQLQHTSSATETAASPVMQSAVQPAEQRQEPVIVGDPDEDLPLYVLNPQIAMPTERIDQYDYIGVLEIPSLGLRLPIMNEWSYPGLKIAPCRYTGTAYMNNMVIAAHNYQSHFGQLKSLQYGESVIFTDVDGNVFSYTVQEIEVLQPTAIEEMTETDWPLTLFTCTIGGQMRVTVRCDAAE